MEESEFIQSHSRRRGEQDNTQHARNHLLVVVAHGDPGKIPSQGYQVVPFLSGGHSERLWGGVVAIRIEEGKWVITSDWWLVTVMLMLMLICWSSRRISGTAGWRVRPGDYVRGRGASLEDIVI